MIQVGFFVRHFTKQEYDTVSLRISVALVAFALCLGCGGESRVPTVKVAGTLTVDGKPFGPANLTLQPNPADPSKPAAKGTVDASGSVTFRTYVDGDGIPVGTYDVSLLADVMTLTPVPPVAACKVEVKAGDKVAIELKATGKATQISPMPANNDSTKLTPGAATTTPGLAPTSK